MGVNIRVEDLKFWFYPELNEGVSLALDLP